MKALFSILFVLSFAAGVIAQSLSAGQMVNGYEVVTSLPTSPPCHPATGRRVMLKGAGVNDPIGFYRCTAPGVWTLEGNNLPIIPTNGLQVEYTFDWPNHVKYSQDFTSTTFWTRSKLTGINGSITAPDGTATANELVEDNTSGNHYISTGSGGSMAVPARAFPAGTPITFSIYLKANTRTFASLQVNDGTNIGGKHFNLSTCAVSGTVGAVGAGATLLVDSSITSVGSGWCRASITWVISAAAGGAGMQTVLNSAATTNSYAGDGVSSIYAWGAQMNPGNTPGTYYATTDLLTVPDMSGNGNNGTIAGTQSANNPNNAPDGIRLTAYGGQSQRVEMPAAITSSMQTVVVVGDVPAFDTTTYISKPFLGSSAALGPKLLVTNACANGSGISLGNTQPRPCWWFGTSGTPSSTAATALSASQLGPGPQMLSVVMGAGAQDRLYINGVEYPYYNQSVVAPSSSASVSRAGLSSAVPQLGADTSLGLYLPQVTEVVYDSKLYFAAVWNRQLSAGEINSVYTSVRRWLYERKGVELGRAPQNTLNKNQLLFDGDSITQGYLVPSSAPAALINGGTYPTADTYTVRRNFAVAGQMASTLANRALAGGIAGHFQPASARNVYVLHIGTNDVTLGCTALTNAAACANYVLGLNQQTAKGWRDAGYKVIVLPMLSRVTGSDVITVVSNTATVTTLTAHGKTTGNSVTVAGSTSGSLNATYTITVTGANTFTFTTSGVSNGTYTGTSMTITGVAMFDDIKNSFNNLLFATWPSWADGVANICSGEDYDASLNSSAAFVNLCSDGAARSNPNCNGVSCWQENSTTSNTHPSSAGMLMYVQQIRNAIDRVYGQNAGNVAAAVSAVAGGTTTLDLRTSVQNLNMPAGNTTVALSYTPKGIVYVNVIQDATGSRTITWPSAIKWVGGSAPTLTTTANALDQFTFRCNGANCYEMCRALDVK